MFNLSFFLTEDQTNYNTLDVKGEQTAATKTLLKEINIQLALVDVLEATTPNNFKAKVTVLANLANTPGTSDVIDMKNYVDANGQAYINALKAITDTDDKNEASEIATLLTNTNTAQSNQLLADVNLAAVAAKADATNATKQAKLIKTLNDLGIKQVATENKAEYAKNATTNVDLIITAAGTTKTKVAVQVAVDKINLLAVRGAAENTIIDKLNVLGLDNIIAANAKAYHTNAAIIGAEASVDAGGDNAKTVAAVKVLVAAQNKAVTVETQVKVINEATKVAEVKTALDALANVEATEVANYVTVRSADRDFVAAYVLDKRDAETGGTVEKQYDDVVGIGAQVDNSVTARTTALGKVNAITNATAIEDVVEALEDTLDEGFNKLSPTQKVNTAEAFQAKLTFKEDGTLKTPFVTIAAVKALI